jgi:hypothetical protein
MPRYITLTKRVLASTIAITLSLQTCRYIHASSLQRLRRRHHTATEMRTFCRTGTPCQWFAETVCVAKISLGPCRFCCTVPEGTLYNALSLETLHFVLVDYIPTVLRKVVRLYAWVRGALTTAAASTVALCDPILNTLYRSEHRVTKGRPHTASTPAATGVIMVRR